MDNPVNNEEYAECRKCGEKTYYNETDNEQESTENYVVLSTDADTGMQTTSIFQHDDEVGEFLTAELSNGRNPMLFSRVAIQY